MRTTRPSAFVRPRIRGIVDRTAPGENHPVELGVLRAAIIWAVKNQYVKGPAPFVQLPPKQENQDRWLTRSEVARLLRAARNEPKSRGHLPLFILVAYYTGARSEAILSLNWTQVDLIGGTIAFNPAGRQQTNKRRAKIRIPAKLRWFLDRRHAHATCATVLRWQGEPIKRIKHSFASAAAQAGLVDVTPHVLRHTCGTHLAQAGVPIDKIGDWLGHRDSRTTKIYVHHHPDYQDEILAVFDRPRRTATERVSNFKRSV